MVCIYSSFFDSITTEYIIMIHTAVWVGECNWVQLSHWHSLILVIPKGNKKRSWILTFWFKASLNYIYKGRYLFNIGLQKRNYEDKSIKWDKTISFKRKLISDVLNRNAYAARYIHFVLVSGKKPTICQIIQGQKVQRKTVYHSRPISWYRFTISQRIKLCICPSNG